MISQGIRHNPRAFVRLVNNLIVDRTLFRAVSDEERPEIEEESLVGLFAVSRILQTQLEDDIFDLLARNQELCDEIAEAEDAGQLVPKKTAREDGAFRPRKQELAARLSRRLDHAPHLFNLLRSAPGQVWLRDKDMRGLVMHFLAETREERQAPGDQQSIVDAAIRKSRGLKEDATIGSAERKNVKRLNFAGADLDDRGLNLLSDFTSLEELNLTSTSVANLKPLSGLAQLRELYMGGTQVTDLAPLSGLAQLQELSLDGTQVTDVGPLSSLAQLQNLWLSGTPVVDLDPLSGLTQLQGLYLDGTPVADLGPLLGLAQLQELWLNGTQVTDVGPLSGLVQLQRLWLDGTKVAPAEIERLRMILPECRIFR